MIYQKSQTHQENIGKPKEKTMCQELRLREESGESPKVPPAPEEPQKPKVRDDWRDGVAFWMVLMAVFDGF